MILRHVSPIKNLYGIAHDGKLIATHKKGKMNSDAGYVALEQYTEHSIAFIIYNLISKEVNKETYEQGFFALYFDTAKMEKDGIRIHKQGDSFINDHDETNFFLVKLKWKCILSLHILL